jgi:hypothetical protein
MFIDGDFDQYVSQGVGVSAHTIELFIRDACGLVSEQFATPRERKDAVRRLTHVVLTRLGTRQLLHSHRATDLPGQGIRSGSLVHDGFLHAAHDPCVKPFGPCPNRAVTVADSDVLQLTETTDPSNSGDAEARVVRGLPCAHPSGSREGYASFDHYQR